jgi:DnaK suppressor protein
MEEQAAESLAADIELTMAQRHTDRHNAIDAALERIANGEYGCCEECDEDIPIARLEIEPTALRCTDCQSRHEVQTQLTL